MVRRLQERFIKSFRKYNSAENAKVLDWGCDSARVVRHIPEILPNGSVYGTDYNQSSIEWNKKILQMFIST
ncbi:hypothetical protein [Chryseobacterium wanjuense]